MKILDREFTDTQLLRVLGVRQLATTIFNYTVGSGIFALPAIAVARLGAAAPLSYLVCLVSMGLTLLCIAEAGSRVSVTGGVYAYVEAALGPLIGFTAGVMLFLVGLFGGAAVVVLFARTVSTLLGSHSDALIRWLIVGVVALFTIINVRGLRQSARAMEIITIAKVLPLLAFIAIGALFVHPANWHWAQAPTVTAVFGTAGVVIFAFTGVESALAPSGEVRSPSRTVPLASFIALGAATVLYLAIQWVALGIQGPLLAVPSVTPLADATAAFAGPVGRTLMSVAATVSMLGYMSANVLSTPRALFAFGRDGFLPRALALAHSRFHTPHVAVVVHGTAIAVLALTGTFEHLAIFSNLSAFVVYILCAIAVLRLRRRNIRLEGSPWIIPGGPLVPLAACVANAWLIYATAAGGDWLGLGIVVIAALLLYALRAARLRAS
jgi:APA family basic amino acid/polyamine antiporter